MCDLVFDCGCRWVLAGAAAHCNIHHPGPPDCPVCADPATGAAFAAAVFALWLLAAAGLRALWRRVWPPAV